MVFLKKSAPWEPSLSSGKYGKYTFTLAVHAYLNLSHRYPLRFVQKVLGLIILISTISNTILKAKPFATYRPRRDLFTL